MITASADFVLFEGSKQQYSVTSIVVDYAFSVINNAFVCNILPAVVSASTNIHGEYSRVITKAAVDAKTGTGTNPSDKLQNQVEQVVADYLDALTENSSVTFTVS